MDDRSRDSIEVKLAEIRSLERGNAELRAENIRRRARNAQMRPGGLFGLLPRRSWHTPS